MQYMISHKKSVLSLLFIIAIFTINSGCATSAPKHIIDTHIHLYDTDRPQGVPWPPKSETKIYRPTLPDDYRQVAEQSGITGMIVVEASPILADNDWVLSVTEGDELFIALVASLNPDAADFVKQLEHLCEDPRFVGIRPRVSQPNSPIESNYLKGLSLLAKRGKTLDLLAHTFKLEDVAEVARRVPDLRIIVNHLAGVHVNGQAPPEEWLKQIELLAAQPNVYIKMSGIFQQAKTRPASTDPDHYVPFFDAIWEAFGEDRIIYGSNWPVTQVAGDYPGQFGMIYDYVRDKGALDKVFWQNANTAYRLGLE